MEKGKARIEGGKHMIRRKGAAESDQSDSTNHSKRVWQERKC